VAYRLVAKRWLSTQLPLLGNARKVHPRNNGKTVFSVVRAATVAIERLRKHVCTTIEGLCVLRGPCRGVILKTSEATQLMDKSSVREAVKKGVSCKSTAAKRFYASYVDCVIEWDFYSSCVRIPCQETTSGGCNRMRTQARVSVICKCNYESYINVVNKSKTQSKSPSKSPLNSDNIYYKRPQNCLYIYISVTFRHIYIYIYIYI
jgi:hypothetical protein